MTNFYDQDGRPLTLEEWAEMFEDQWPKNVRVARTEVESAGVWVSTIWNGFNAGGFRLTPGFPEAIFETAVFRGGYEISREHHFSKAGALARHAEIVSDYRDRTM